MTGTDCATVLLASVTRLASTTVRTVLYTNSAPS